jgi:uncharacterized protein YqgC (DUF456 family)
MEYLPLLGWVAALLLILLGCAGTVLPALPGAPLVLAGMILAAWLDNFQRIQWWPDLTVLIILAIIIIVVDFLSSFLGATRVKASPLAVWGAAIGTVVGIFGGIIGLLFGPFIGAAAGEYWAVRDLRRAGTVGLATWLGIIIGVAIKIGLLIAMLAVFVLAYYL